MTKQNPSVAFAACIVPLLLIGMPAAQAKQCSVAPPSDLERHWSYRIIDERKCWYEGQNMVSRSSLKWPAKAFARRNSDVAAVSVPAEKPDNSPASDACCWPALDNADSFESRWSALDAMGKYEK
jgi:hypothetical protein